MHVMSQIVKFLYRPIPGRERLRAGFGAGFGAGIAELGSQRTRPPSIFLRSTDGQVAFVYSRLFPVMIGTERSFNHRCTQMDTDFRKDRFEWVFVCVQLGSSAVRFTAKVPTDRFHRSGWH